MNLPSDALKTVEKGAEMLLRVINAQRQELHNAITKLDELHTTIMERLPLDEVINDKINADTRRDNHPSISSPAPAAGEVYRGVKVFNP